jgi:hypothetical protein
MSSIFSDPPFVRGRTLASGDFGDAQTDPTKTDVLGSGIVGAVKAFQDVAVSPISFGSTVATPGSLLSNRLVYCQAVRYRGDDKTPSEVAGLAGSAYLIDTGLENGKPFCQITNLATDANVGAGREVGILDEYLTGQLKKNDVVWVVRKGPCAIKTGSASSIADGARVELTGSVGRAAVFSSGNSLGISISGAAVATSGANVRVNLICDDI